MLQQTRVVKISTTVCQAQIQQSVTMSGESHESIAINKTDNDRCTMKTSNHRWWLAAFTAADCVITAENKTADKRELGDHGCPEVSSLWQFCITVREDDDACWLSAINSSKAAAVSESIISSPAQYSLLHTTPAYTYNKCSCNLNLLESQKLCCLLQHFLKAERNTFLKPIWK